ncbi:sulfatase-like hydrolase/transferase, partial [Enterococcus faecalis]
VFNAGDTDELYNLKTDPYEQINQIENPLFLAKKWEMQQALANWMEKNNDNLKFEFQQFLK